MSALSSWSTVEESELSSKTNNRLPCHILTPHQDNPTFLGRQDILEEINSRLNPEDELNKKRRIFAICGLGGIGKTQIALKYALNNLSRFQVVLWVPAESREKILARFTIFAAALGLIESTNDDQKETIQLVKEWFKNADVPYLIIFDNADSEDNRQLLAEFLPEGINGSLLITSRDKSLIGEFSGILVAPLDKNNATQLLINLTSQGDHDVSIKKPNTGKAAAEILVKLVDRHPLAITQLASLATNHSRSLDDLGTTYLNLSHLVEDSKSTETTTGILEKYPHSLGTVLEMNYQRLDKDQQDLLNILSFLDPDKINFQLLAQPGDSTSQQNDNLFSSNERLIKAREFLVNSSMLYENHELGILWMHRLVQTTCHLRMREMPPEIRQKAFESAFDLVQQAFPVAPVTGRHDRSYWSRQESCVHHVVTLSAAVQSSNKEMPIKVDAPRFSKLLQDVAWYLYERGTFQSAFGLLDQADFIAKGASNRTEVLLTLGEICRARASLCTETNRPLEAYKDFREELKYIREAYDGHVLQRPDIREVFSLGGIANALQGLHRYEEAEKYYRDAINAFIGMPGTLSKMSIIEHNFAICLWIQGRLDEAMEILDRIIVDKNDMTSYRTAHAMFALGNVQTSQGSRLTDEDKIQLAKMKFEEALATHEQTLKLFIGSVGEGHHKVGNTLYKIGCHRFRKQEYSAATKSLEDALVVFKSSDGFSNEIARVTYMLGCTFQETGATQDGQRLIEEAEGIRKSIMGVANWTAARGVADFDCLVNCWSR